MTLVSENTGDIDSKKLKKEKVTKTGTKEGGKLISGVKELLRLLIRIEKSVRLGKRTRITLVMTLPEG